MADTLEKLLSSVSAFQKGANTATQQVLAALGTQQKLSNDISDQYKQQATDDATVMAAKQAAEYKTQLARVQAANAAGANLSDTSEVITSLSAAAADAQKRKDEALAAIADKDSVGFMDNPVQYIVNQFTVNGDISKHNIANQQLESAHNRIMEVNAEAQQSAQTQNMISEPLTAASMAAATRSASVAANVAATNAQIAGLNYNTKGIEFALNAKKEVLALGFQANNAQMAEKQYQRSLEALDLQKKEFEFRQKEWKDKEQDKADQQALGKSVIDTINFGRKALLGPNAEPLDDISGKMALSALKGKGVLTAELQKFYDAGERSKLTGKTSLGTTPAQAADTIQTVPVQLNPTQGPIKNILAAASSDTSSALKNADMPGQNKNPVFQGLDKKDKNSIAMAFNGRAQQILDGYAAQVKPGDGDNPYQVASINQLGANSPTVQALPIYQKVFAPMIKAGVQLNDPKQIVALVGAAVSSGTITHKEALDLTTIYHVGVTANLAMRNFSGFGLTPRNSYNAQVETDPSAWNPNEIVDLTKPDALSRALIKMQSAKLRDQLADGTANIFTGKPSTSEHNDPARLFNPSEAGRRDMQMGPQKYNYPDAGVMTAPKN